jgi:hypothetical protein
LITTVTDVPTYSAKLFARTNCLLSLIENRSSGFVSRDRKSTRLETNPDDLFSIKDSKQLVLAKSLAEYVGTSVTVVIKVKNTESFETASQSIIILVKHVDRCLRNGKTCSDDARCVKLNQTYHECHCEPGFTGDGYSCSNIDDCIGEDTCQNGATCVDSIEMFSCICPKDFDGDRCEISLQPNNPCKNNPCKNNAGCVSEDGKSYVCECSPGWTGATCSKSVDDCADSACLAGGQCEDRHRTYVCECPAERLGPRCQYIAAACKADDCHIDLHCIIRCTSSTNQG